MRKRILGTAVATGLLWVAPSTQAAMSVIDGAAIAKRAAQIEMLEAQLQQAQAEFQSMTGGRGMEQLLAGTVRNYLPSDWATLEAALRGARTSGSALARQIDAA